MAKGIEKGKAEGIREGVKKDKQEKAVEVAKKLLAKGISVEEVAEITDLPVSEIQKLIKH